MAALALRVGSTTRSCPLPAPTPGAWRYIEVMGMGDSGQSTGGNKRGKGVEHLDDREPLAYAYDGLSLVAVGYKETIVEHWEKATNYTVSRTPRGEDNV